MFTRNGDASDFTVLLITLTAIAVAILTGAVA